MKKIIQAGGYTFNKTAKTITCAEFTEKKNISMITNVTAQKVIYQFNSASKGGSLAGDTLTLVYDTSAMNDADELRIDYYDPSEMPITMSDLGTDATGVTPPTGATGMMGWLSAIYDGLGAIFTRLGTTLSFTFTNTSINVGNFPATQPVSGPLTNTELRASAVPVSGPLTNTELRASAVPVSGTVTANLGTLNGAALDATVASTNTKIDSIISKMPASLGTKNSAGSSSVTLASDDAQIGTGATGITMPAGGAGLLGWLSGIFNKLSNALTIVFSDVSVASSNITANGQTSTALSLSGHGTAVIAVSGTFTGTMQIQVQDVTGTWRNIAHNAGQMNDPSGSYISAGNITAVGMYRYNCAGFNGIRLIATAWTSGSAAVQISASQATGAVTINGIPFVNINNAIPAGANAIGAITTLNGGQTAHSAAATGNPVRIGGKVKTAVDTTLVAGDASDLMMTTDGAAVIKPYSVPDLDWSFPTASGGIVNTTDMLLKAAGAAGVRNYITGMTLQNANATATEVVIKDNATVIWRGYVAANSPMVTVTFPTPLKGTAATAMNFACITTGAQVYVNVQGYQAP